jgi:polysaccharide biosynthesis transport protein
MKTQPTAREQLDRISTLVRRSFSYWKRALVVFLACMAVAVPYVFTRPRAYKSETVILYQETIRSSDVAGGEGSGENARRVGARLREVLLSRASLEPIIKDLHLYAKPGQTLDRGELIEAVDDMRKNITFRAREGDTFEIAFVGPTPKEAQEVTRRLGDCILQEAVSRRAEHAKTLKEFLDAEAERNKTDLKQKDADFAKFVALHPALSARLQGQSTGGATTVTTAATRPTSGDPVLASLEARAARIERQLKGGKPEPPKPVATFVPPPDSAELVAARKDLADKLARFTDKHPDVIAARNRVKAAEAQQAETNEAAAATFAAQQAKLAHEQRLEEPPKNAADETTLRKELADLQNQIFQRKQAKATGAPVPDVAPEPGGSEVALEVEFRRLQREVNEGRERQRQLDERLFKASITASSVMNDRNIQVSILDPAFLPIAPVSRSRTMLLAGLLALAILLAVATALFSARVDDRVYDRVDLERLDVLPVLGVIPRATPALPPKRI